jgi:hypothetical protein
MKTVQENIPRVSAGKRVMKYFSNYLTENL